MPEPVSISAAVTCYALGVLGLLTVLLVVDRLRAQARRWRISRVKLCNCRECHLTFLVDRFDISGRYVCPRCGKVNEKRRPSKSPWGTVEEAAK